jgi:hypothetical protein
MALANVFPITPSQLPRSEGRARVSAAVAKLQDALGQLYAEEARKEAAREQTRQDGEAKARRRLHLAQARQATRAQRVEVSTKFFWDFASEGLDAMRELAAAAKKRGERGHADAIERRVDEICTELERVQTQEAAR